MGNIDGSARSENGENAGVIKAGGVSWVVLGLGAEAKSMSTRVCQVWLDSCAIYLGTIERGARASGISDAETVLGEGVQDSTGLVEKFEGLVTGVGNSRGDLQVP